MKQGFAGIGLDNPKTNTNVGGILRLAKNYDAKFVAISGRRYSRQAADTMKSYRHIPIFHHLDSLHDIIPYDCIPVAVDLVANATSLPNFTHPKRAFYIFGAEDATLGKRILDWCDARVYIPTDRCMNLAVTVGIVLYDRMVKRELSVALTKANVLEKIVDCAQVLDEQNIPGTGRFMVIPARTH